MSQAVLRWRGALILALALAASAAQAERITLLDRQTAYQRLLVVEDTQRRERYLYGDDPQYMQGMISLKRPQDLVPGYLRSALLGLLFAPPEPSALLFVGLGPGSLPRYLSPRYPRARLDAVEIDPEVPPVARRYFALPSAANLKVAVRDGREFIRMQKANQYDLVLMDAYFGPEVPRHLATLEFMAELRRAMKPGGVVVANLLAPTLAPDFWPVAATYRAAFAHVRLFATDTPWSFMLLASDTALSSEPAAMHARIRQLKRRHRIDVDLGALATLLPPWGSALEDAPVLHDAP